MILKKVYLPEPPSIGRTMNVKPRRRKKRKGGGFSWSSYWTTREDSSNPNLFVDLSLATGDNDGSSWANAFQTFAALWAAYNDADKYDVYIKRLDTPTRLPIVHGGMAGKTYIFNATGVGTEISTKRGIYFGSEQVDISSATIVSGTVYKIAYAGNAVIEANDGPSKYGVWACNGAGGDDEYYYSGITSLKGASPYDNAHVVNGRYFYDDVANEMYFNIGREPVSGDYLEVMALPLVIETCDKNNLIGGIFRFGLTGHDNGTCTNLLIFNCDFSYNATVGLDTACDPDDGTGGLFEMVACTINNNGSKGIQLTNNAEGFVMKHCSILNNVDYGVYAYSTATDIGNSILNCVISGNGSGIRAGAGTGTIVSKTTIHNNIIWGNTTNDLDIANNDVTTAIYDYNAVRVYAGKATQQTHDVVVDPVIDSNGLITSESSAFGEGKSDIYTKVEYDLNMWVITKTDGSLVPILSALNLGAYQKL
jgi:hypothetical protein